MTALLLALALLSSQIGTSTSHAPVTLQKPSPKPPKESKLPRGPEAVKAPTLPQTAKQPVLPITVQSTVPASGASKVSPVAVSALPLAIPNFEDVAIDGTGTGSSWISLSFAESSARRGAEDAARVKCRGQVLVVSSVLDGEPLHCGARAQRPYSCSAIATGTCRVKVR